LRCNFCTLKKIKSDAEEKSLGITLIKSTSKVFGGTDVFIHPKNVTIESLGIEKREDFFAAWLWEIDDKCHC
jgi:hypothetical protein